jgi:hypothetical protein
MRNQEFDAALYHRDFDLFGGKGLNVQFKDVWRLLAVYHPLEEIKTAVI